MKYLKIILLTTLVALGACKKDKEDIEKEKGEDLSYVDKYSKGTVSFTLDGKKYTKEFKSEKAGMFSLEEENHVLFNDLGSSDKRIFIVIKFDDLESTFRIHLRSIGAFEVSKFPAHIISTDKNSSSINLYSKDNIIYSTGEGNDSSFVNVTKYDYDKRIIEGEFEFKLENNEKKEEKKIIKNGKFSLAFTIW